MNLELYKKYGNYNKDGYFIIDHDIWNRYAQEPSVYRKQLRKAKLHLFIPFIGIIFYNKMLEDMGLMHF